MNDKDPDVPWPLGLSRDELRRAAQALLALAEQMPVQQAVGPPRSVETAKKVVRLIPSDTDPRGWEFDPPKPEVKRREDCVVINNLGYDVSLKLYDDEQMTHLTGELRNANDEPCDSVEIGGQGNHQVKVSFWPGDRDLWATVERLSNGSWVPVGRDRDGPDMKIVDP